VVVRVDIPEGEEVTISYVDPQWPKPVRRETLKRDYGFECRCERCLAEMELAATGGDVDGVMD